MQHELTVVQDFLARQRGVADEEQVRLVPRVGESLSETRHAHAEPPRLRIEVGSFKRYEDEQGGRRGDRS